MTNAAIRLLGLDTDEIKSQAQEIIFGQLRQVIASMGIEEINRDRDKFLSHVQNSVEPELRKIGLVLINVNITDIQDESGYIDAIGRKAASQAVQQARGDVADQEKLGEVRVAEAQREREILVAVAEKERELGTRGAARDQAIGIADLERDQRIGEQEAEFQKEVRVRDAQREMRIKTAAADAAAVEGENEAQALVVASKAQLAVKNAEAYQLGETRKREAEAAVQEAAFRGDDPRRPSPRRRRSRPNSGPNWKPSPRPRRRSGSWTPRPPASSAASRPTPRPHAIFAKFEAEARGEYELLAKKAEGLEKIVSACGGSDKAFQMLMLEHLDALTEASAKAISNIKFDKVVVWEGGGNDGKSSTAGFLQNMARTLPPMMEVMRGRGGGGTARIAGEAGRPGRTGPRPRGGPGRRRPAGRSRGEEPRRQRTGRRRRLTAPPPSRPRRPRPRGRLGRVAGRAGTRTADRRRHLRRTERTGQRKAAEAPTAYAGRIRLFLFLHQLPQDVVQDAAVAVVLDLMQPSVVTVGDRISRRSVIQQAHAHDSTNR